MVENVGINYVNLIVKFVISEQQKPADDPVAYSDLELAAVAFKLRPALHLGRLFRDFRLRHRDTILDIY